MKRISNELNSRNNLSDLTKKIDRQLMDLLVNELKYLRSKNVRIRPMRIA